jgi:hypothetical protein
MTKNRWMENPEAVREAERFYKFVGEYVISFQWMEGKIDEVFLLARGHDARAKTFSWLAQKTNAQKIDEFQTLVKAGTPFGYVAIDGWYDRLRTVVDRLHEERRRRNSILHAQFLMDFLAIGAPVVRTHVKRQAGDVIFEQEDLSPTRCDTIMGEIAQLAFDLGMICVQLIHVYKSPEPD